MDADTNLFLGTGQGVFRASAHNQKDETENRALNDCGVVRGIITDPDCAERVWVATERNGVWRTEDGGKSWSEKNVGLVYKHTLCLALHPVTGELYVGTEPACIFKSDDRGETWMELDSLRRLRSRIDWTFPNAPYVAHVRGIGLNPADPDVIFGAVEEGWLIRSTDGGDTWVNLTNGTEFDSHTVTFLPGDSGVVISASGKGLYRSVDNGINFQRCDMGIQHPYLVNVVVHADRPNVLYTAGAGKVPPKWREPGGPGAGFYRSDDAGQSWKLLTGGLPNRIEAPPRSIAIDGANSNRIYVGMNNGDIWMSDDGGEEFVRCSSGLPPVLSISPTNND